EVRRRRCAKLPPMNRAKWRCLTAKTLALRSRTGGRKRRTRERRPSEAASTNDEPTSGRNGKGKPIPRRAATLSEYPRNRHDVAFGRAETRCSPPSARFQFLRVRNASCRVPRLPPDRAPPRQRGHWRTQSIAPSDARPVPLRVLPKPRPADGHARRLHLE